MAFDLCPSMADMEGSRRYPGVLRLVCNHINKPISDTWDPLSLNGQIWTVFYIIQGYYACTHRNNLMGGTLPRNGQI
ncbi:hypothetical protein CEXT_495861 [Caerostris extrusa]|uniref:Uncharacterized protein n=1 Tax=Caerostris extrusa TaxID=172846 RepID=A0AAV4R5Q6_CAEEX|nr:hypothetical protein CEXT_495861 [Caerostris extrusa]